jgi:hypothetical protein
MSRQADWQRKKIAAGLCGNCGKQPLGAHGRRCEACQDKHRLRSGSKPWRLGGPGRPPKSAMAKLGVSGYVIVPKTQSQAPNAPAPAPHNWCMDADCIVCRVRALEARGSSNAGER